MNKKLFLIFAVFLMVPNCADAQGFLGKIGKALDKVGKVIDKLPSTSTSNRSSSSSNSSSPSSRTYATKQGGMTIHSPHPNLKIKISRCEAAGDIVIIDFMVENVGSDDVDVRLMTDKIYDDESNVFEESVRLKLGNSGLNREVWMKLPSEIPIKGRIQIEKVPESVAKLSRIDIKMISDAWDFRDVNVKIENVPINREGDE